ncbi:5-formyltetrahydrofolate cyclo-ligase [Thermobrachium celere]|uniref:5-formyltetrahydrofolate cyclo-ligase n=1 Tax=Thermobrachium celere TaxID=53422 RepID=UPI0019426FF6|nr:5-formyltetrahydrofolate cyclo-ligase [Thermobrachium celere]GFR34985.1 5-formyltetrahydrofolate cyclo-ligase [Thermobrachium celere]
MKSELRSKLIEVRKKLSKEDVEARSRKVVENILNWDVFNRCSVVMLYSSYRNEVDLDYIADELIRINKTVVYPKSIKETYDIVPYKVDSKSQLIKGAYGILEPISTEKIDKNLIDIILVPGVAFDKMGYRLGYGAGYYDRFLKDYKGIKAGVCYDFQIVEDVYRDDHDVKMDYLVCEREILKL